MQSRRRFDRIDAVYPCTVSTEDGVSVIESFIIDVSIKGVFVSLMDSDIIRWGSDYNVKIETSSSTINFISDVVYREKTGAAFDIKSISVSNYNLLRQFCIDMADSENKTFNNEFYEIVED